MLIGPLQFSAHCFPPGVLFPPLVRLNPRLLHHHIANERLVGCWHLKWRQAMAFSLIAAICADRLLFVCLVLFCRRCFSFLTSSRDLLRSLWRPRAPQFPRHFCAASWRRADEVAKCCGASADKKFNKVISCLVHECKRAESLGDLLGSVFVKCLASCSPMSTCTHAHILYFCCEVLRPVIICLANQLWRDFLASSSLPKCLCLPLKELYSRPVPQ